MATDEDWWRIKLPNELFFQQQSDVFLEMRGATGEFFISAIIGDLMTTNDNDQPISLVLMTMTNDVTDDDDNEALPTTVQNGQVWRLHTLKPPSEPMLWTRKAQDLLVSHFDWWLFEKSPVVSIACSNNTMAQIANTAGVNKKALQTCASWQSQWHRFIVKGSQTLVDSEQRLNEKPHFHFLVWNECLFLFWRQPVWWFFCNIVHLTGCEFFIGSLSYFEFGRRCAVLEALFAFFGNG